MSRASRKSQRKKIEFLKKSCYGKIKHKYRTSAEYVLEQMDGDELVIYPCHNCKNFHIGNDIKLKE